MSIQPLAMPTSIASTAFVTPAVADPSAARAGVASNEAVNRSAAVQGSTSLSATSPAEKQELVEAAVKAVKDFIQPMAGNLEFQVDDETGETIIKIVDSSSGELIRQIPSEEMLEIAKALDRLQGILVKQKA